MKRTMHKSALETRIKEIESSESNAIDAAMEIISLCRSCLWELRDKVIDRGFLNDQEEIQFFKCTKQFPLVNLIYHSEIMELELIFPTTGTKAHRKAIKTKIKEWHAFFETHADFFKYMVLEHTHMDQLFFTRKNALAPMGPLEACNGHDPMFHTSHDLIWARMQAYRRAVPYMRNRLKGLDRIPGHAGLRWTAAKVALTELVYALYHSKSINYGKADVKQIARAFELMFNIELGDNYRTYIGICSRKKDRTKFLDELTYILSENMGKGDV